MIWILLAASGFSQSPELTMVLRQSQAACAAAIPTALTEYDNCVMREFSRREARAEMLSGSGPAASGSEYAPASPPRTPDPRLSTVPRTTRTLQDQYVSGVNRICVYGAAAGQQVETIGATQVCPIR